MTAVLVFGHSGIRITAIEKYVSFFFKGNAKTRRSSMSALNSVIKQLA